MVNYREHKSGRYDCCRSNKHVWGWDLWERLCITPVKQPWFTSLWAHPKRQNYPESGFSEISPCWTSDNLPATMQMCFTAMRSRTVQSRCFTCTYAVVTCRVVIEAEQDWTATGGPSALAKISHGELWIHSADSIFYCIGLHHCMKGCVSVCVCAHSPTSHNEEDLDLIPARDLICGLSR